MRLIATAFLFVSFLCMGIFAEDVQPRDLEAKPLSKGEWKAYRVSRSLAKELGAKLRPECINASFNPGNIPVAVQFYSEDEEGDGSCGDPHNSISVELDKDGNVVSINVVDA